MKWQTEPETHAGAAVGRRHRIQIATVIVQDGASQVKPETHTGDTAVAVLRAALEPFEHELPLVARDPRTVVPDQDVAVIAVGRTV